MCVNVVSTHLTRKPHTEMTHHPTHVLNHGGGRYTVTTVHAAPQDLPKGTYGISFDPMTGYSLYTLPDLEAPNYRVYGRRDETIAKVLNTYGHLNRSLGVLFEGDKGIGKSSTTVELARQARDLFDLPVFMVNNDTPGLSDYLAKFGECVIVFDEFEKNFPRNSEGNAQEQFLTLFDGTDSAKRLYIVTVNDTNKLSPFFLNRPGRFHYLISFDYPDIEAVTEYLTNEAPQATAQQLNEAVAFAYRARLNYDHLRAIALELTVAGPNARVEELVADLNLRDTEDITYEVKAHLACGTVLTSSDDELEMFSDGVESLSFNLSENAVGDVLRSLTVWFTPTDAYMDRKSKVLTLDGDMIKRQQFMLSKNADQADDLQEWERELLGVLEPRRAWATASEDDIPAEDAESHRVVRLEFTTVRKNNNGWMYFQQR